MILTCINNCIGGPTLINLDYITNIKFEADFDVHKGENNSIGTIYFSFDIKIYLINNSFECKHLILRCAKDPNFRGIIRRCMENHIMEFRKEILDKVSLWGDLVNFQFDNFIQQQIDSFNEIISQENYRYDKTSGI